MQNTESTAPLSPESYALTVWTMVYPLSTTTRSKMLCWRQHGYGHNSPLLSAAWPARGSFHPFYFLRPWSRSSPSKLGYWFLSCLAPFSSWGTLAGLAWWSQGAMSSYYHKNLLLLFKSLCFANVDRCISLLHHSCFSSCRSFRMFLLFVNWYLADLTPLHQWYTAVCFEEGAPQLLYTWY